MPAMRVPHRVPAAVQARARRFAPVLARMVELLSDAQARRERLSFGAALRQASIDLDIPVPREEEAHLLTSIFQIMAEGRIPGCPDA